MVDPVCGLTGTLVSKVYGPGQLGEVRVAIRGGTELYLARANESIAMGATVLIVAAHPGRIVDVVPWISIDKE